MSEWHARRLRDALNIHHGWAFKGEFFSESGELIVLTPGNFKEKGGFKPKGGVEKYYLGTFPSGFYFPEGAVVVAMTEQAQGLLGSSATIPRIESLPPQPAHWLARGHRSRGSRPSFRVPPHECA